MVHGGHEPNVVLLYRLARHSPGAQRRAARIAAAAVNAATVSRAAASRLVRRGGGTVAARGTGAALCLLCLMLLLPLLPASSLLLLQLSQYVKSPTLFKKSQAVKVSNALFLWHSLATRDLYH